MRFKFCGDRDVPDWVVAEVSVLSKISCVRMKLICKQVINELLGGEVDFTKVQRLIPRDKGFAPADTRAALAAMNFVLRNASVYAVTDDVLNRELQQLGLPKENSDGISRPFRNNRALLMEFHSKSSLSLPRPRTTDWRVDAVVASSETPDDSDMAEPSISLRFSMTHRASEAQPLPVAKAAVLSNPARYASERAAQKALEDALRDQPRLAEAAAAVALPAVHHSAQSALLAPRLSVAMTADTYFALSSELRAALATLVEALPRPEDPAGAAGDVGAVA